jgi:hypothetical protein
MATTDILKLQSALVETERLGEQFLDVRAEVGGGRSVILGSRLAADAGKLNTLLEQGIRTDKARNEAREAATALRRQATGPGEPVWLHRPGGVVLKVPKKVALATLQAGGHAISSFCFSSLVAQQLYLTLLHQHGACRPAGA